MRTRENGMHRPCLPIHHHHRQQLHQHGKGSLQPRQPSSLRPNSRHLWVEERRSKWQRKSETHYSLTHELTHSLTHELTNSRTHELRTHEHTQIGHAQSLEALIPNLLQKKGPHIPEASRDTLEDPGESDNDEGSRESCPDIRAIQEASHRSCRGVLSAQSP